MILGAGAAILLRILFTLVVTALMGLPFLKIVGGLALFYIAIKLLTPEEEDDKSAEIHASERLWKAVRVIAAADVVMSLDNVIAISGASKGNVALFVFGLMASIPLIVAGARVVMGLLSRFPVLIWAGGALLGWIAGQVIATDPVVRDLLTARFGAASLGAGGNRRGDPRRGYRGCGRVVGEAEGGGPPVGLTSLHSAFPAVRCYTARVWHCVRQGKGRRS